jgi:hypothetical protein
MIEYHEVSVPSLSLTVLCLAVGIMVQRTGKAATGSADNLDYFSVFLDDIVSPYIVDTTFDAFLRDM